MAQSFTRRTWLAGTFGAAAFAARPKGILVDTHVHLFDPSKFPYHPQATYKPPAAPLEAYLKVVKEAGINHTIIVHPEPYQDDHRYLEYCFQNEPSPGFFKGTCLFDPILPDTAARMEALVKKLPNRIVAMRIHENLAAPKPPTMSGPIRDRDLHNPGVKKTWEAAQKLGLAIQFNAIPRFAPAIGELAAQFPDTPVIIDHLGIPKNSTPAEYEHVIALAKFPRVFMKYSAANLELKPTVKKLFDAFGPDRMIWGGLGMTMEAFEKQAALLDQIFDYASESDRAKIRGLNAMKLFHFA